MLTVRAFDIGLDYPEICEWWRARNFPYVPLSRLPRAGLVVQDAEHKYCAGWIYLMESGWVMFEWIVSNPNAPPLRRAKALSKLVETVKLKARLDGAETVFSSMKNPSLIKLMKKHGFDAVEDGMTNMIARLA